MSVSILIAKIFIFCSAAGTIGTGVAYGFYRKEFLDTFGLNKYFLIGTTTKLNGTQPVASVSSNVSSESFDKSTEYTCTYGGKIFNDCKLWAQFQMDSNKKWIELDKLQKKQTTIKKSNLSTENDLMVIKVDWRLFNEVKFDDENKKLSVTLKGSAEKIAELKIIAKKDLVNSHAKFNSFVTAVDRDIEIAAPVFPTSMAILTSGSSPSDEFTCSFIYKEKPLEGLSNKTCDVYDFSSESNQITKNIVFQGKTTKSTTIDKSKYYLVEFKNDASFNNPNDFFSWKTLSVNKTSTPNVKANFDFIRPVLTHTVSSTVHLIFI